MGGKGPKVYWFGPDVNIFVLSLNAIMNYLLLIDSQYFCCRSHHHHLQSVGCLRKAEVVSKRVSAQLKFQLQSKLDSHYLRQSHSESNLCRRVIYFQHHHPLPLPLWKLLKVKFLRFFGNVIVVRAEAESKQSSDCERRKNSTCELWAMLAIILLHCEAPE